MWAAATGAVALGLLGIALWPAPARRLHRTSVLRHAARPTHRRTAQDVRLALPTRLSKRAVRIPILMYHRVDVLRPTLPRITLALTVAPADFERQMRWLHSHGFHAVSQAQLFAALERGGPLPRQPVMITFDDGYRDVLANAAPVLAKLHMPATAYVITSRISGRDTSFLTWNDLARLERNGVTVGSHTVHHLELPYLTDAVAMRELVGSRIALEHWLHHPVQWFAYPAGAENAHASNLVRRAGYVLAVTTHPGDLQQAETPLALARYEVLASTGVNGVAALVR
jgi:peptidoglycan/xylan/chitin deacetylase (PgdA/CDA1 family)